MANYSITLIPGDGIGPEVTDATLKVLRATGISFDYIKADCGQVAIEKFGTPLPEDVITTIKRTKVALKGPVTTPIGSGFRSVNVELRRRLGLFACVRPCKLYKGVSSPYKDVDLVVIRENSEDLYTGVEFAHESNQAKQIIDLSNNRIAPDSAISIKAISFAASKRIVQFACEYAKKYKRKKITVITKANIMKYTDGLFLEASREVAKFYPDIEFEEKLVDNMAMQLVQKPHQYDLLVLPNLYGDIISDLCAGLVGGLGVVPGANFGDDIAIFEPVHGSAPKYQSQNKVNPVAMILSAKMMLEYFGEMLAAKKIENAVSQVIAEHKSVTYDLGGSAGTMEMAEAIANKIISDTS